VHGIGAKIKSVKEKEICHIERNAVWCGKHLPMFRRNVVPPSSEYTEDLITLLLRNYGVLDRLYSTFYVRVPADVIFLQLCTPKVVGVQFKLYMVYNLI
jgi:hypothetical protein